MLISSWHRASWGRPGASRSGLKCGKVLRMSWWDAWGSKLSNPADNVVAAVVVLIGVAITAVVTLLVSAANRRHERLREARERVFQPRADAYVSARSWLRQDWQDAKAAKSSAEFRAGDRSDDFLDMSSVIAIYAHSQAAEMFSLCVYRNARYFEMRMDKVDEVKLEAAALKVEFSLRKFDELAQEDVQRLRRKRLKRVIDSLRVSLRYWKYKMSHQKH